ncbi:MAG: hypothetical protein ACYTEO_07520 [Planctomycetota bacterium]
MGIDEAAGTCYTYRKSGVCKQVAYPTRLYNHCWMNGEFDMGDKGKRDKGKREQQKKAQLSPKEKRRLKKEKKNQ